MSSWGSAQGTHNLPTPPAPGGGRGKRAVYCIPGEVYVFEGKTVLEILAVGGVTLWVLIGCSILSLAVVGERLWYYATRSREKRVAFMGRIAESVRVGDRAGAVEICAASIAPFAGVVKAGLELKIRTPGALAGTLDRAIAQETHKLERLTTIVGTIGNTAVYIGLFGTVLGIIRAFRDISLTSTGGLDVVIGGVAEALVSTAAGLAVAVPAVILYNYLTRRVDRFVDEMELCASELSDLLGR